MHTRIVFACAAFVLSFVCLADTYYVNPDTYDGSPTVNSQTDTWETIDAAAQEAGPGDVIEIFGGTYREVVKPANNGTSGNPITFRPHGNDKIIGGVPGRRPELIKLSVTC